MNACLFFFLGYGPRLFAIQIVISNLQIKMGKLVFFSTFSNFPQFLIFFLLTPSPRTLIIVYVVCSQEHY